MTSKIEHGAQRSLIAPWIESHGNAYRDRLVSQGHSISSRQGYERTIRHFCAELGNGSMTRQELSEVALESLRQTVLSHFQGRERAAAKYRLERFIKYLVEADVIRPAKPPAKEPGLKDRLRAEYVSYLRLQRGLSEETIYNCQRFFERFMRFRFWDALGDLNSITVDDVISFLQQHLAKNQSSGFKTPPSHLRNLFHFFFWSGKTKQNLANSIPRIARPYTPRLPRYMKPDEIQRLIDAIELHEPMGRRNFAMLLLMARLGLRAPEVIAIQLEDIDWRAGEILVPGKGKLHDRMPLPREVGEAIVNYIQNERMGDSRTLFVSGRAPHQAFKDAQIINYVLHKAFEKTGLKPPQKNIGSHLLRHSLATALLGQGASLEEISHVLRHRSRATTTIYAKCDITALRSIA
jgi:integrase/recombinase XerD